MNIEALNSNKLESMEAEIRAGRSECKQME